MPAKRTVLAELTRRELRTGLDLHALQVPEHCVEAQLVDAPACSRKARVGEVMKPPTAVVKTMIASTRANAARPTEERPVAGCSAAAAGAGPAAAGFCAVVA